MDEYLDDVLDFSGKYSGKDGFDDVLKELKKVNIADGSPNYAMEGASFMLDKIKKTPEITPSTIKKFDGKFEGEIDNICEKCRFDIELNDGSKYEYKSYSEASINRISSSEPFLKQHLSYLGDATDINKIKYEFDAKKFSDRSKIVEQFKKMYQKNADLIFRPVNQGGLGERKIKELFGNNINGIDDFIDLTDDVNSSIYKFIKVE